VDDNVTQRMTEKPIEEIDLKNDVVLAVQVIGEAKENA